MRRGLPIGLALLLIAPVAPPAGALCRPERPTPVSAEGAAADPAEKARAVPEISFSDMSGTPHTLAEFKGQVVLLEFWASWCIPCRKGVPFLNDVEAKHAAEGLRVVALTMETDDDAVRSFVAANPARFLVGRDPTARSAETLEVAAMPTTFLLDRTGSIVARYEGGGETAHEQALKGVEALLRDQPLHATTASRRSPAPKGGVRPWERGFLADPMMNLDGGVLDQTLKEHVHASKEGASGNGGIAGGGCGCN